MTLYGRINQEFRIDVHAWGMVEVGTG